MRSIRYQIPAARLPIHRDLASFDFGPSCVDRRLIRELADLSFTDNARNVVLIGGPGTGKTHLATALGVSGITRHERRVRFFSTVDLVNALEQEKVAGKSGRIVQSLRNVDLVILDELGYLPFSQEGGALLLHLRSKLYEHTSEMTTALLDRLTLHCHIIETGNESWRFQHSSAATKSKIQYRERARRATPVPDESEPF